MAVSGWAHSQSRGDRKPDDWLGAYFQVSGLGRQEPGAGNQVQVRVAGTLPSVIDAELSSDPFNLGKNIICQNQKLRNQFLTMYFKYSLRILPLMQFEQKQIFKAYFPKS